MNCGRRVPPEPWRIRPKPKPGEALTSWLLRIGGARGKLPHQLIQDLDAERQFWNRDGDLLAPESLLTGLAQRTGTPAPLVRATTLGSLVGVLDETIDGVNQSRHVRPLGVYHRTRRAFGQQYCSICLRDDVPYYRLIWRLTLFPTCTRHGVVLRDRCPECQAPIVPHRGGATTCHACQADLAVAEIERAGVSAVQLQHHNQRVLDGHPVSWPGMTGMHPLAFFGLQLHLLSRLISNGRAGRLRAALQPRSNADIHEQLHKRAEAKFLSSSSAHDGLAAVERLMRGWPMILVGHCLDAGVFRSWLIGDERTRKAPYVLQDVCSAYLAPGSAPRPTIRARSMA